MPDQPPEQHPASARFKAWSEPLLAIGTAVLALATLALLPLVVLQVIEGRETLNGVRLSTTWTVPTGAAVLLASSLLTGSLLSRRRRVRLALRVKQLEEAAALANERAEFGELVERSQAFFHPREGVFANRVTLLLSLAPAGPPVTRLVCEHLLDLCEAISRLPVPTEDSQKFYKAVGLLNTLVHSALDRRTQFLLDCYYSHPASAVQPMKDLVTAANQLHRLLQQRGDQDPPAF